MVTPNSLFARHFSKGKAGVVVSSLLIILTLLLTACGGANGGSGSTTTNHAKATALTVVPSPIGAFTNNFSPFNPTTVSYGAQGLMYETLLFFNRMDGSVKPWLASSYKFSDDAKTLTFTLRSDVKWSDGQSFSSDDVAFTLNMLKQYPAADTNALWNYISAVANPDPQTVTVTFTKPYTPILWYLAGQTWIVPKHAWSGVGDPTKYTNTNPIVTGPYKLKSFTPQLIALTKNTGYWQPGKPEVQEIHYPSFNSNTTVELALNKGELDWTGLFTPKVQETFVNRDPAHNKYWFPSSNVVMMYLNTAKAPFNDLAVRQAISYALDRDQMYKVAESGYEPVASPTGLVLPANKSFLSPDYSSAAFTKDVQKATQALDNAGYKKGADGIYVGKDGKPFSFNINVVTGWTDWVTVCQIVSDNLKAIGMNVKVNAIAFNSYFSGLQTGQFDTAISWTNVGPTPFYLYDYVLNSTHTKAIGQTATSNWERWQDSASDKLLSQFATTADPNAQQQAIAGLQKIMVEQLPSIPLVYGATWYEYTTKRFTGFPNSDNPYAVPSAYTFPDAEMVVLNLKAV
jgi:peptide/nickel transport system substrate-binding protein